jgi:hypothetical protein
MKAMLHTLLFLILILPASQSKAQNDAGVPPAVVESWTYLIGSWDIDGHVGSTPVKGTARFEWADGKHSYFGQQVWKVGENENTIYLAQIGGWDAAEQATVEQGFSSVGSAATVHYRPPAAKGDTIEGSIAGLGRPDAHVTGDLKLERISSDEFRLTTTIDGELVHSLTYSRKTSAQHSP